MRLAGINDLEKATDNVRMNIPMESEWSPEESPLLERIEQKQQELKDLIIHLRLVNKSNYGKIQNWFRSTITQINPNYAAMASVTGNEKKFILELNPVLVFNLNLKEGDMGENWVEENPEDCKIFIKIKMEIERGCFNSLNFITATEFEDFFTVEAPTMLFPDSFRFEFNYTKKLTKDDYELNRILSEVISQIMAKCHKLKIAAT